MVTNASTPAATAKAQTPKAATTPRRSGRMPSRLTCKRPKANRKPWKPTAPAMQKAPISSTPWGSSSSPTADAGTPDHTADAIVWPSVMPFISSTTNVIAPAESNPMSSQT